MKYIWLICAPDCYNLHTIMIAGKVLYVGYCHLKFIFLKFKGKGILGVHAIGVCHFYKNQVVDSCTVLCMFVGIVIIDYKNVNKVER